MIDWLVEFWFCAFELGEFDCFVEMWIFFTGGRSGKL